MNKKLFLSMFAAAGMLLATSCSNDELDVVQSGNEAQVTFSLAAEGGIATRAISDGTGANVLYYAIFDADGKLITTINGSTDSLLKKEDAFPNGSKEDNVEITLAKGQKYTAVFWAQDASCNAYTVNAEDDGLKIAVDYEGNNNDETRDAFFKAETFTVTGNTEIDVVLKRPFAQINVGVYQSDWDAAVASGITIAQSSVVIKNAATSINLLTGEVDGEQTVEYGFDIIPAQFTTHETLNVDLNKDGIKENYVYLSMSYILANDATTGYAKATLEDLDFTFAPISGNNINFSEGLNAVPVQRNWRTNIIGQILTGDVTFNITIDPIYDGEYNNGEAQPVNINGVYYATIQDAVNNVEDGDVVKIATGTYNEVIDVANGKTFTIEAAGPDVVIAGINQQTNGTQASKVTVKGVTIDNSKATNGWFTGTAPNIYVCVGAWGGDLTFEDCNFIVDGSSSKETGVMTWWTTDLVTLTFTNCTFEGKDGHANARSMQIYGNVNLTVTGCTFNTKKDYTLKYVAQDGNIATFTNNTVNNSVNFVELGSSVYPGTNYTANINNNTLGNGVNTHIIANVENQTVSVNGIATVGTANGVNYALSQGYTTVFAENVAAPLANSAIYGTPVAVVMKEGGVLDGNGFSLDIENPQYNGYAVETYGGTIKNLTIDTPVGRGIVISSPKQDIYIDNVVVDGPGYAINTTEHNGKNLIVTNSTVKGWTSFDGLDAVSFTKCNFGENSSKYWQSNGYGQDYDRLIRPYVSTTFTECVFEKGYYLELSALAANAKITLKDCVCGEVEITAENYNTYISVELPDNRTLTDCVAFE